MVYLAISINFKNWVSFVSHLIKVYVLNFILKLVNI